MARLIHRKSYTAAKPGKSVTVCGKMVLSQNASLSWANTTCDKCKRMGPRYQQEGA